MIALRSANESEEMDVGADSWLWSGGWGSPVGLAIFMAGLGAFFAGFGLFLACVARLQATQDD